MELYWYCIDDMDEEIYGETFALLDEVRKKHVRDLAGENDRKRTVAAEWLARTVLAEKLGCQPREVPVKHDEDDKPYLEGNAWYVSLSHSGQYAVCALNEKPLGVDVEVIRMTEEKPEGGQSLLSGHEELGTALLILRNIRMSATGVVACMPFEFWTFSTFSSILAEVPLFCIRRDLTFRKFSFEIWHSSRSLYKVL